MRAPVQGSVRSPIYGRRRSALEGWLEKIEACYRSPQKGIVLWMIRWPRARAQRS
jgi:hypothetical protein